MRRVIKIGGSLLLRNDLRASLSVWLEQQQALDRTLAETWVIVGGGELIDAIRHLDRVHKGDPEEVHWMCVEMLDVTARFLARWFGWPLIAGDEELQRVLTHGLQSGDSEKLPAVVSVMSFYNRKTYSQYAQVPLDWRTTTDAIAAIAAVLVQADELVLLKSCEVDPSATVQELAEAEIVDESMPMIEMGTTRIRVVQLPQA